MKEQNSYSTLDALLENPFQPQASAPSQVEILELLPAEHRQRAIALADQINPADPQAVLQFGVAAQAELSKFTSDMLEQVRTKDASGVTGVIAELLEKITEVNVDELQAKPGLLSRLFGSAAKSTQKLISRYQKVGADVDKIAVKLEKARHMLLYDVSMLDTVYEKNKEYHTALGIYAAAGKYKLAELQNELIPELQRKASLSQDPLLTEELNDIIRFANRLEKRVHDLLLSRTISLQTAPQIRLIQENHQVLVEKIQSSILTAVPLWKNQLIISLTLSRQQRSMELQKKVTQTTNDILIRNAELLKTNSVAIAQENERGLVDLETLQQTQGSLVSTLEEVLQIQQEGRIKRQIAEQELLKMEQELKEKVVSLRSPV
ncbi:toxic anion resistance protein [Ectobacillus ponti]|uniref:Toxic anion resistance protein n=1 Tax=Ectobacillus ponti TaxID=2961894 RepID=A0AA41XBS5_9BACI|nr:toxic anion resistance protein [Ectobacillus ponti]MCP8969983.1 toxic anion resistance protein [Ectobacillus ponti]